MLLILSWRRTDALSATVITSSTLKKETIFSVIIALENQNFSSSSPEKTTKGRYQWKCWFDPGPTSQVAGFLTHGSFLSWQGAQKACKLLTEKAKEACRGRTQLGILPGFCQSQHTAQKPDNYNLLFSLVEVCSVGDFQPPLLQMRMAKRPERFVGRRHRAQETWHYNRSAVLAATAQPRIQVRNVRYSLQN